MIRKFLFFTTLFLLVFGGGKAWATSIDISTSDLSLPFSTWATQEASTRGANTFSENSNVVFYNNSNSKHFSITNGTGLNLPDNNMNDSYFVAIPLTGINGSITLTIQHASVSGSKVSYSYILGDGETDYSTSTAGVSSSKIAISDEEDGATTMTKTISCANSNAVLYIGRKSSDSYNKTPIQSITISTPTSGTLQLLPTNDYVWTFSYADAKTASELSSATTIQDKASDNCNFEIKNAAIETISPTDVDELATGITKRVYFDGMGSTTEKYVHVKVLGRSKITVFGRSGDDANARTLVLKCGDETKNITAAGGSVSSDYYVYTGTEPTDVYVYSSNSGIYLYGIKVEPTLDQFEFNADEVYYYKDSSGDYVNNTTFEYNPDRTALRLKLKITPDFATLTSPSFTVTSDNTDILDPSSAAVYKASDNRIYVNNVLVKAPGTATLTFTFNGATGYAGPLSITQTFTVNKKAVSIRSAGGQPGNSAENAVTGAAGTTFNSLIVFNVDNIYNLFPTPGEINKTLLFEVSSSNSDVVNINDVTFYASADDLSKGRIQMRNMKKTATAGSAVITLTYKGNDYYSEATTTFTRYTKNKGEFRVSVSDLTVQNTQRTNIVPKITNDSGHLIGFDGTSIIEIDDETSINYNDYFDFSYSISANDAGLSLDPSDNSIVVSERGSQYVGKTATVTVTATVKDAYADNFTNPSNVQNLTVTVIKRQGRNYLKFYLDKEKTIEVIDRFDYTMDGSTSVFTGFPDGRIIYVDLDYTKLFEDDETVDQIWFSYNEGSSKTVSRASTGKNDYGAKLYLLNSAHGGMVPIHAKDLSDNADVFVNFQCYKKNGSSYESVGSVVPVKFVLEDIHTRPAEVYYDPVSDGTLQRSTAQSVVAIGTPSTGNDVYAKFSSTGTNYTIEGLLNEPNVIYDVERTGVFSTEVAARKISGVQINYDGTDAYVSKMTTMTYWYLFATTLSLSNYVYNYDLDDDETPPSISSPTRTATYYNKVEKTNIDESSGSTVTVTYRVDNYNGAAVTVDENTGEVTLGSGTGYAVVTVSYKNDKQITVNKRTSTMEDAQITYTIYLTRSSEHLPKIEPSSRKFYPTINVTVTADEDWDTWYVVQSAEPTEEYIRTNGTKVDAGASKTFKISATSTVWAVAYDGTSVYSKKISETYTLGSEVLPPYFVPAGLNASYPYYYYTPTLGVEARTQTTGSEVYYTIGKGSKPADPVINASGTIRYDGQVGITLNYDGTTYIKAIAYKDGIQSSVVTVSYIHSSLPAPHFDVNGTGHHISGTVPVVSTDRITVEEDETIHEPTGYSVVNFYTLDGTEPSPSNGIKATTHFLVLKNVTAKAVTVLYDVTGTAVSTSDVTTVGFTVSGSNVWEANDDTAPGRTMDSDDGLVISTDATLYSGSGIYASTSNNAGTKVNLKSLSGATVVGGNANHITYAQEYITATFGGFDHGSWSHFTINDDDLGQPLDGVGSYNLKNSPSLDNSGLDAKDEEGLMYSHVNTGESTAYDGNYYTGPDSYVVSPKPTKTYEKTFKLPAQGTFVKFEPERDGDLTIWALQQGAIHYQDDYYLMDKFVRRRPVYFIDEQGRSIQASEAVSSARLSGHWSTIINGYAAVSPHNNWFTALTGTQTNEGTTATNNFYDNDESEQIYNMFMDYFQKRGDYATGYGSEHINVGDPIQPIPIHTASRSSNPITERGGHNADDSNDMTGYVLASGGYVRYTFPVKAGKTYYFFGHATKVGIRGFRFTPTENVSARPEITMHARNTTTDAQTVSVKVGNADAVETELSTVVGAYANQTVNVTLDRTFTANTWTSLVLPFSVSATQLEKIFGAKAEVTHLKDITADGRTLVLKTHRHQMIVAGTPIFFYPRKTVENPKFEGVRLEASSVEDVTGPHDDYSMIGTFVKTESTDPRYSLHRFDYYFGTDGKLYRYDVGESTTDLAVQGTRTWLRPKNPSAARELSFFFEGYDDDDVTGIIEIVNNSNISNKQGVSAIYNLSGQKVSDGSLDGLSKGVYIVNGKKRVIK